MYEAHESFAWETTQMSISLIESKRASQSAVRNTVVSVALHAAMITLAVYATASAKEIAREQVEHGSAIFYPPLPSKPRHPPTPAHAGTPKTPSAPGGPVIGASIPPKRTGTR